jgi:hypothetical protein
MLILSQTSHLYTTYLKVRALNSYRASGLVKYPSHNLEKGSLLELSLFVVRAEGVMIFKDINRNSSF